nr:MAG TPA: hypothetical protein [Caudoviricetes sp.]DAX51175.1 MAG TPA: hypothetical protein [Caudoviricetes sp.]
MMDRDNLYYAELAASGEPPSFNRGKWEEFDDAVNNFDQLRFSTIMRKNVNSSGIEVRLWSYDNRRKQATLINVEKGE